MASRRETTDNERQRIVSAYLDHQPAKTIAAVLGLKLGAVYAAIYLYNRENRVQKHRRGGTRSSALTDEQKDIIKGWVDEDCSLSLRAIKQRASEELHIDVSEKTIDRCLQGFRYTLKRSHCLPRRRNTAETIEERAGYSRRFLDLLSEADDTKIIFVDETGFCANMRTRRGRSLRGTRAVHVVSGLRTRNFSVFSAVNKNSLITFQIQNRAFNAETFIEGLDKLFDELDNCGIGQATLVMDNVPFHRTQAVQTHIRSRGHNVMYLPPYSPFLNPIENVFSKWKEAIRSRAPNSEEQLLEFIEEEYRSISTENCNGYFRHMLGMVTRCLTRESIIDE